MMSKARIAGGLLVVASFLLLVASAVGVYGAVNNKCCVPPYVIAPTAPPPGGSTDCKWIFAEGGCRSLGAYCKSTAWQIAMPGACQDSANLTCAVQGTTGQTIDKGSWGCQGNDQTCSCKWSIDWLIPGHQNVTVDACTGNGCPAPPPPPPKGTGGGGTI